MNVRILTVSILLLATASASAQGYLVRTGGYYDRFPYPPAIGGTWSYSPYPPMVTVYNPWGRAADVPLQPKVLYYDTPFLTPQGWHRPTSITVMPDPYRRAYRVPSRVPEVIPSGTTEPRVPEAIPPARSVPETTPARPAAKPIPARRPVPADAGPEPPRAAPKAGLPPVPDVPKLPDLPQIPGSAPEVPKLGPAPTDLPPAGRPPG